VDEIVVGLNFKGLSYMDGNYPGSEQSPITLCTRLVVFDDTERIANDYPDSGIEWI